MRFGMSTHLFHDRLLSRAHLQEVASFGFDGIELFATRSHFDYHDRAASVALRDWLDDTGLTLMAIHAPVNESFRNGQWGASISNAMADERLRRQAVEETRRAVAVAEFAPTGLLVVHLGTPLSYAASGDNQRSAMVRSLEEIGTVAGNAGMPLALEVIPNDLSDAAALVRLIEEDVDLPGTGICFDFGHALLMGDVVDAIETASGYLIATHVSDNDGVSDQHLAPFAGRLEWDAALMAMQKVGYDGDWTFELAGQGSPRAVLTAASEARRRFEVLLRAPLEDVPGADL
jgi:sugar phosphate isomerase/epimerase